MSSRLGTASALLLTMAAAIVAHAVENEPLAQDGLTSAMVRTAYDKVGPSLCLLSYAIEIRNPNSGQISKRDSFAIGVLVSEDGLVLAHGHMKLDNRDPQNIRVTVDLLGERKEYPAVMLKKPNDINVCFLQIETEEKLNATPLQFSKTATPELGDPLVVLGLMTESMGHHPNALGRRIGAILEEPRLAYCLDQSIPFGYVGGPAISAAGEIVGVTGFELSAAEGGEVYTRSGHPLLIQAALFQSYIENPPGEEDEETENENAWLGVFTQPLTDDLAEYWDLPKEGGIVVSTVMADSPAAIAGLLSGDVIIAFNGETVDSKEDREVSVFTKMIRENPLGESIGMKLYREGVLKSLEVTLTTRPKSARDAEEHEDEVFGVTVREMTADVRILANLPDSLEGVIVRKVESGSPASVAGLPPNAIILSIGDTQVTSIKDFIDAIADLEDSRPAEVAVLCRVGPQTGFFRIQPRWEE